jgi:two-component system response regulator CpxR
VSNAVPGPDFIVNDAKREVSFRSQPIVLTDIEYRLLATLLSYTPQIVDREVLTEKAFDRPSRPFDRSLDMHVSRLRKKLEALDGFDGNVKSIRNSGYLLVQNGREEGATD